MEAFWILYLRAYLLLIRIIHLTRINNCNIHFYRLTNQDLLDPHNYLRLPPHQRLQTRPQRTEVVTQRLNQPTKEQNSTTNHLLSPLVIHTEAFPLIILMDLVIQHLSLVQPSQVLPQCQASWFLESQQRILIK